MIRFYSLGVIHDLETRYTLFISVMAIYLASTPLSQWLAHTNVTVIDVYCCFKQNDLSLGVINMTRKHGARKPTINTEK